MFPIRKIDVVVNGAVCNGRNCTAGLINNNVIINPPPVRNAPILVIYTHKGKPFKDSFVGDSYTTVFVLSHKPDEL